MKYTWNDQVYLLTFNAEGKVDSRVYAVVVGLSPIETEEEARHFNEPIGSAYYTIEFADGSDAFVPESRLEPYVAST